MEIKIKEDENILKLQGGGLSPAMASYIQVPDPQPTAPYSTAGMSDQEATSNKKQQTGLLDEKQAALIRENGLPSDVEAFLSMVNSFSFNFMNSGFMGSGATNTEMMKINATLGKIKYNKDRYDDAIKNLKSNGGMQEIAVTTTGRMVVMDEEGKIKQITPTEYSKDREKYSPLTNADVADLRANNPALAFNTNIILSTLDNGLGMQEINKLVQDSVDKIGKTTVQSDKYTSKVGNKLSQGLQEILSEDNADGVYKVTQKQSGQSDKAKYALNYLYTTLPESARTLLRAKAAAAGMNPDSGAYDLLTMIVQSRLTDDISTEISYDKSASNSASGGSKSGDSLVQQGPLDMFINGKSTDTRTYHLNPGTSVSYFAKDARVFNGLPNNDNKTLASTFTTLGKALDDTALGSMGKKDSVTFGDELVSDTALDRIVLDTRNVTQVFLPYKTNPEGKIVPDYDTLFAIEELEKLINSSGVTTEQEKKQMYDEAGLGDYYNIENNPNQAFQKGLLRPFIAVSGLAADNEQFGISDENRAVEEVPKADKKAYINQMYNVFKKENPKDDFDEFTHWFTPNDDVYKGTVLIPVSDDRLTPFAMTEHIFLPKSSFMADELLKRGQSSVNGLGGLRTNFMSNAE